MQRTLNRNLNELTVAIHSSDNSFGFGLRYNDLSDNFFVKKFDKDLCNNLIVDFRDFITKENLNKINKLSVSIGPSNFNASRLIVVLARTISQQIDCQIDSFSSFKLMAKRIALKNNLNFNKQSFWIFKKLKRRGYIAGKYEIDNSEKSNENFFVKEIIIPKLFKDLDSLIEPSFEAEYDDLKDLKELLDLSHKKIKKANSWEEILPIYPLSATN